MRIVESNRRRKYQWNVYFDEIELDVEVSLGITSSIRDIAANNDFSKIYITCGNSTTYEVINNDLSDISQATLGGDFTIGNDNRGIHIDSINEKMYVGRADLYEVDLDNSNLSNSTNTGNTFSIPGSMRTMRINSDLSKLLFIDNNNDLKEYDFGTNGDVTTLSNSSKNFVTAGGNPNGMDIIQDKLLILSGLTPSRVREYLFSSNYDISTLTSTDNEFPPDEANLDGILVIPPSKKILIAGGGIIQQYSYNSL